VLSEWQLGHLTATEIPSSPPLLKIIKEGEAQSTAQTDTAVVRFVDNRRLR
jgi:hypothetical protein